MLKLHSREIERIGLRVEDDFRNAVADHYRRMSRFAELYRKFSNQVEQAKPGEEDKSNYSVPFMAWQTYSKWARVCQGVFGDDAQIVAAATGPSDQRTVEKVGRFATYRYLRYDQDAVLQYAIWFFRAVLFGRAFAYVPYEQLTFRQGRERKIHYDGPKVYALWPDDVIVPAEDVQSIQDFSFVIRKFRATPQQLLDGERSGKYFGVTDEANWERILKLSAEPNQQRDQLEDANQVKDAADESEGVVRDFAESGTGFEVHCWYGRWRLPAKVGADVEVGNYKRRELDETDLVVYYVPGLNLVIGVDDLAEIYPHTPEKRPVQEIAINCDGTYWCRGVGELTLSEQEELTDNSNKHGEGTALSICPPAFYEPASGADPKTLRLEPRMAIPTANATGVNFLRIVVDHQGAMLRDQHIRSWGERVTGESDQNTGHVTDRPNAPDTARGQLLLAEQANVRAYLDGPLFIRYHLRKVLRWLWALDRTFAPENVFFRVTEEEANGAFEVKAGGSAMTAEEFNAFYDFDIQFASNVLSKEADKARALQLFQLDLANPLIASNPRALWIATNRLHKAMGDANFADVIPEPPDLGMPKPPQEEWARMLQGETVEPHPNDNDDLHLMKHYAQLEREKQAQRPDEGAIALLMTHVIAHQKQKKQKLLVAALAQEVARTLATNTATPGAPGLNALGGMPMGLMQLQNALGELTGGDGSGTRPGGPGGGGPGGGSGTA